MNVVAKTGVRVAAVESAQVVSVVDQKAVDAAKAAERSKQSYTEQVLSQRLTVVERA